VGYDVIAVLGVDKGLGAYSSTEFFVQFSNNTSIFKGMFKKEASAEDCSGTEGGRDRDRDKDLRAASQARPRPVLVTCNDDVCDCASAVMVDDRLVFAVGAEGEGGGGGGYSTSPPSRVLEQLGLRAGRNTVLFESREYQCQVACHVW
jgi:hypothetical protein